MIGLTGGIGCGKSAVGRALEELGLKRLDTDLVAREVVDLGTPGLQAVVEMFGMGVLTREGELDRRALAAVVFQDPGQRKQLERLLHPLIWERVEKFIEGCRAAGNHAVVEVPLLFENGREASFDTVWVVATSPELQRVRLAERNGWSPSEVEARVASQMPLSEKIDRAGIVIHNEGTPEDLMVQVREAWQREIS
ncbi:MAG: dephospho-CoA kinase [Candidatus Eremiobacteraeota bacterium]|nr:dephospho-CoA kinase [Candidatus Eremiobacteraeota bacterium]